MLDKVSVGQLSLVLCKISIYALDVDVINKTDFNLVQDSSYNILELKKI